ncbi:MAG: fibronectin type III domain-containing protein [Opitutaceae bacterium]|jgi:hypothetical protein
MKYYEDSHGFDLVKIPTATHRAYRSSAGHRPTLPRTFGMRAERVGSASLATGVKRWIQCGLVSLLVVIGVAGFSPASRGGSTPDSTIHLSATLISPVDVALEWKDTAPGAAGHTIEYATDPNGPYIVLSFCPPNQTKYTHPRLMPQTTFYYRVRPIYGPVSNTVVVTLPKDLSDATYATRYAQPEDYSWSGPKLLPDAVPIAKKSIRNPATAAQGAPLNLKATFVPITVSAFQLTWTICSSDEEGFMLETKDANNSEFTVAGLIPPKINAFGWALHPPQREVSYRLRAYYYGTPSNLVRETTVLPSEWKNPPAKPAN